MTAIAAKEGDLERGDQMLRCRGHITVAREQECPRLMGFLGRRSFQSVAEGALKLRKPKAKSSPVL